MLTKFQPKLMSEGAPAGGGGAAPTPTQAPEQPAVPTPTPAVEPKPTPTDDLRARLAEASVKKRSELLAENAALTAKLNRASEGEAALKARLDAIEQKQSKTATDQRAAEMKALFDAAKVKAEYRGFFAHETRDLDATAAAAKVDELVRAQPLMIDAPALTVDSPWTNGKIPSVGPSGGGQPHRPSGRDFMPRDRLPQTTRH